MTPAVTMASSLAKSSVDPTFRPLRRADVTVHELDGEALVFDAGTGDTHRLNPTAWFIWRQCEGNQDARQVAERVSDAYDISVESALGHVERVFRELRERQLVVVSA